MNKLIQNLSPFRIVALSNKIVFYKKGDDRKQPKIRYRHVNPIYPPPGLDLKLPGRIKYFQMLEFQKNSMESGIFPTSDRRKLQGIR